jgi:hypothetical protein
MGTPVQFDYGRRSEYLTSVLLSPYALTVPIKGHDDRFGSDFLCVGLDESDDDVRSDYQKVNPLEGQQIISFLIYAYCSGFKLNRM